MCVFVLTHRTNDNIVNVSRSIRVVDLLVERASPALFINQVHVVRFFFPLAREREYDGTVLCTRPSPRREVKLSFSSKNTCLPQFIRDNRTRNPQRTGGYRRPDELAFAHRPDDVCNGPVQSFSISLRLSHS